MALRNIGGDANDRAYRYRMPTMQLKIEGRGNGIKTVIVNMDSLAKSLKTDPAYVTKYFGCELGAQSKYDAKKNLSVVNGAHDINTFNTHLDTFINRFILCPNCALPEIDMSVKKDTINIKCAACGYAGVCQHMQHRLATYIVKNPPPKNKKEQAAAAAAANDAADGQTPGSTDDQLFQQAAIIDTSTVEADSEWSIDTSAAAVEARRQAALGDRLKELTIDASQTENGQNGDAGSTTAPVDELLQQVKTIVNTGKPATQAKALRAFQKKEKFGNARRTALLFEACFDENILKQIKPRAPLLRPFLTHPRTQRLLLDCVVNLVGQIHPKLMKSVPHILKGLYDEELAEEEALIEWYNNPSNKFVSDAVTKKVCAHAKQFIEWVQSAEEESDDDDSDEE